MDFVLVAENNVVVTTGEKQAVQAVGEKSIFIVPFFDSCLDGSYQLKR
ncbi:MAG: hypothetical protein ABIJ52_15445 [Pseudomonadota bacterium]|nr:hypothetical protein [Pseudomonadota bacterium]